MRPIVFSETGQRDQLLKVLSPRERDVARLVKEGLLNKEIAARLGIKERTVRAYVQQLLIGLHVRNRVELTRWVLEHRGALDGDAVLPGFTPFCE